MSRAARLELDTQSPDAIDGRHIRAVAFQGVRVEYVRRTLDRAGLHPVGLKALVVGSGRGDLARALADLGLEVSALDPSPVTTEIAGQMSLDRGLGVVHKTGSAEDLPFADATFDLAYYADTFEITCHLQRVIEQAARVLRTRAVLIYDTVNRTLLSRLTYLGAFQALPPTRFMPPGRYAAGRLRTPRDLARALDRSGLVNEDVCAFHPAQVRRLVTAILARKRGTITDDQIAPLVDFKLAPNDSPIVTYLGYARRL